MLIRTLVAASLASLVVIGHAEANNGEWTTLASACVPAPGSPAFGWSGGGVGLAAAGTLVLRCNVTDPADFANFANPVWNTIEVTYNDADGMGIDSRVQVQLFRVAKANGATAFIASFESNAFAAGTLNSSGFAHAFDFTNAAYYVQVVLTRTAAGGPTRVHRVRLH